MEASMKKYNLKRFLASLLAVLMLASVTGVSPAVFAAGADPVLKTGVQEVLLKPTMSADEVKQELANLLLENPSEIDAQSLDWTYTCAVKGTYKLGKVLVETKEAREANVPVFGETYTDPKYVYGNLFVNDLTAEATYTYPALKDNTDDAYTLYLNGQAVYINKVAKLKSAINVVKTVPEIAIPYNADGSVNNAKLHETIFNTVVTGTTPANLNYDQLSYSDNFSEGEQTVKISYAGNDDYNGTSANVTVKFVDGRNVAFIANAKPDSFNIGFVGNDLDVAATKQAVLKQLVTKVGDVELDKIKVEYMPSILGVKTGTYKDFSELSTTDISYYKGIKTDIRLTYAGDATHKAFSAEFKDLNFADNRTPSVVALVDVANITYNMDASKMIEEIIKNAIDSANSTLPADYKASDFTVKYYNADEDKWLPIEGGKLEFIGIGLKDYPHINAGDGQQIQVTFNGSKDYKPSDTADGTLNVAKADVKVSMKLLTSVLAGQKVDKDVLQVTLNPDDPELDLYIVFVGFNTYKEKTIYVKLTEDQEKVIDTISDAQKGFPLYYKEEQTIRGKLNEGMTVDEFITYVDELMKNDTIKSALEKNGIDAEMLQNIVTALKSINKVTGDLRIAIGSPKHAGLYQAFAVAVNKNYNTGVGTGTVIVAMNAAGMKLEPNTELKKQTITVSEAEKYKNGEKAVATLTCDGNASDIDQSCIHYRFTGLSKIYSRHDFPTAPGKYIVTVSVRGGDYYALPTTFTFTVKAD